MGLKCGHATERCYDQRTTQNSLKKKTNKQQKKHQPIAFPELLYSFIHWTPHHLCVCVCVCDYLINKSFCINFDRHETDKKNKQTKLVEHKSIKAIEICGGGKMFTSFGELLLAPLRPMFNRFQCDGIKLSR